MKICLDIPQSPLLLLYNLYSNTLASFMAMEMQAGLNSIIIKISNSTPAFIHTGIPIFQFFLQTEFSWHNYYLYLNKKILFKILHLFQNVLFLKVLSSFFATHGHSFKLKNTKLTSSLYNMTYVLLFLFYLSFFSLNRI